MTTTMYLLRHAATDANLAVPAKLQGRHQDSSLARLGIKQAELTRDLLAVQPLDHCYCSPLHRAVQTARIICEPHELQPQSIDEITECDVGSWEGLDWGTIRQRFPDEHRRFMANPAEFGYPGGESFAQVHERTAPCLDRLLAQHAGQSILVVSHHIVNRTYLAGLLGLSPGQARQVALDNCGISVVTRTGDKTTLSTLNAAFHLLGVAA